MEARERLLETRLAVARANIRLSSDTNSEAALQGGSLNPRQCGFPDFELGFSGREKRLLTSK